jgi:hypothetical protein
MEKLWSNASTPLSSDTAKERAFDPIGRRGVSHSAMLISECVLRAWLRCWRVIRKDERTKHLDELIMEGEETRLEASSPFENT